MNRRDLPAPAMPATNSVATMAPKYVGRSIERLEDAPILTGRGRFGDDLGVKPGTLHAAIVRSPHAHARLVSIDARRASNAPGVRAVLTGTDLRAWSRPFVVGVKAPMEQWALAIERVRYVGEPIAVVVAESRALAEDAADLVEVHYDPLPPVVSIEAAIAPDAPILHAGVGSNVVNDRSFRYGEPEAAFRDAAHRIALDVHYPRNSCSPIECAVVIAEFLAGEEGYEVTSNFMGPFSLHAVMAMALNVSAHRLRHRSPRDSGGSFGVKQAVFPYAVLMCLASRKAGAPVKWVEDRLEHLSAATSATARFSSIEAAVTIDGRITALSYDQLEDCGAYLRAPEPATLYRMHGCLTGAYAVAHLQVRNRVVMTNKTPSGLVRGFGGPQVYFALERLVQRIAVELALDPLEVYRRNFVAADAFPYRAAAGALLDSGDYQGLLEKALTEGGYEELLRRRRAAREAGKLYGIGFAAVVEPSVSNMGYITTVLSVEARNKAGPKNGAIASATVSVDLLGGVVVTIASTPAGQGHMTVCAQVVADVLGITPGDVVVNVEFDTHKDAWSVASGNYSSRFAGAVAGTVHLAARRIRDKLALIAAESFGCDPQDIQFRDGRVIAGEAGPGVGFARFAASAAHWSPQLLPKNMEPGLRETVFWTPEHMEAPDGADRINPSAAYGFVFDICAVELGRATGRVRIDRYVTAHDAGVLLNPALADGQIRGAFAQGLGAALFEEFRYGPDGSFQSGTLADYLIPTACEVPDISIVHQQTPSPFTPLGAKGLGEGNNMSTPVCIANALADALGVKDIRLPMTPARTLALLGIDDPAPSRPELDTRARAPSSRGSGKTLRATGVIDLKAPPADLFAVLLDPLRLARVIPGCDGLERIEENCYRAEVTLGVGLIRARYRAELVLSEIEPPRRLRLAGSGLSSLGSAFGTGVVELAAVGSGTRLRYDYDAQVSGKVAAVGSRMLEGAAKVVLHQLFEALGREASGSRVGRQGWWARIIRAVARRS
jgi:2-furoyl-CoA dehydrogenase large subunit